MDWKVLRQYLDHSWCCHRPQSLRYVRHLEGGRRTQEAPMGFVPTSCSRVWASSSHSLSSGCGCGSLPALSWAPPLDSLDFTALPRRSLGNHWAKLLESKWERLNVILWIQLEDDNTYKWKTKQNRNLIWPQNLAERKKAGEQLWLCSWEIKRIALSDSG